MSKEISSGGTHAQSISAALQVNNHNDKGGSLSGLLQLAARDQQGASSPSPPGSSLSRRVLSRSCFSPMLTTKQTNKQALRLTVSLHPAPPLLVLPLPPPPSSPPQPPPTQASHAHKRATFPCVMNPCREPTCQGVAPFADIKPALGRQAGRLIKKINK